MTTRKKKNVKIDWSFDPAQWMAGGGGSLRVVTQLDSSTLEAKWGPDTEPNRKVRDYLKQKK